MSYKLLGINAPAMEIKIENTVNPRQFNVLMKNILGKDMLKSLVFGYEQGDESLRSRYLGINITIRNFRANSRKMSTAPAVELIKSEIVESDLSLDSLYYNFKTCTIEDYSGAMADFDNRLIRTNRPAETVLCKNSFRLIRCIRLAISLGFSLHSDILKAMTSPTIRDLSNWSENRIRNAYELAFILGHPSFFRAGVLFSALNLNTLLLFHYEQDRSIYCTLSEPWPRRLPLAEPNWRYHVRFDQSVLVKVQNMNLDHINTATLGNIAIFEWLSHDLTSLLTSKSTSSTKKQKKAKQTQSIIPPVPHLIRCITDQTRPEFNQNAVVFRFVMIPFNHLLCYVMLCYVMLCYVSNLS